MSDTPQELSQCCGAPVTRDAGGTDIFAPTTGALVCTNCRKYCVYQHPTKQEHEHTVGNYGYCATCGSSMVTPPATTLKELVKKVFPTPTKQEHENYGTTSIDGLPADEAIDRQKNENRQRNQVIDSPTKPTWEGLNNELNVYIERIVKAAVDLDESRTERAYNQLKAFIKQTLTQREKEVVAEERQRLKRRALSVGYKKALLLFLGFTDDGEQYVWTNGKARAMISKFMVENIGIENDQSVLRVCCSVADNLNKGKKL